ncbi:MAG: methionine gamma-lyase family protein [Clostridia bacterium]|nr:methionine gamma-lyase family protein [Clostridia bacterium]
MNDRFNEIIENAEKDLFNDFKSIENIALINTEKVLNAFRAHQIALRHFNGTTGYGYDDIGRQKIAEVYADIFGAESAIVSPLIVSGTHALTIMLFSVLRPNDILLSISGKPYDTLQEVISGSGIGSLRDYNIAYDEIMLKDNDFDYEGIKEYFTNNSKVKAVFIGRSRGYEWRNALSVEQIEKVIKFIKSINNDIIVMVDNCYGEFVQTIEPTQVGADIMAGSLNKNPGGGLVNAGGYIAGKSRYVEQAAYRLTAPSIGSEVGSYSAGYKSFFQGLFIAPSVVMNAIKASMLFGQVYHNLGYDTMPLPHTQNYDIIRSIKFDTEKELVEFVKAIQYASPIDSHVTPEAWDMPGYESKVIMAAGTFVEGASIELSADSPIREPYIAYLQGALTYEHAKLAVIETLKYLGK